jgi:phosphoserine phosphatase
MAQSKPGEAVSIKLEPGDVLGLISDGIYEYENEVGMQFGQKGVASVIDAIPNGTAEELVPAIMHATRLHGGRTLQADDITIVLVRRQE